MDDALERKIATNEALLREANEAIARGLWPGDSERLVRFRCECAQIECNEAIELTSADYEAVRANGRRFVLIEGHQHPDVETVVDPHRGYVVVEKVGIGGAVAEEHDPRSQ
jgi:hypothetical protein